MEKIMSETINVKIIKLEIKIQKSVNLCSEEIIILKNNDIFLSSNIFYIYIIISDI